MTRDQFIALIVRLADPSGENQHPQLFRYVREKADAIYDPALEGNDLMQVRYAVKSFAIAAEGLDDLVVALSEVGDELKGVKRRF